MISRYAKAPENDCPLCGAPKGYSCFDDCNLNEIIYHKQEIEEIINERNEK